MKDVVDELDLIHGEGDPSAAEIILGLLDRIRGGVVKLRGTGGSLVHAPETIAAKGSDADQAEVKGTVGQVKLSEASAAAVVMGETDVGPPIRQSATVPSPD